MTATYTRPFDTLLLFSTMDMKLLVVLHCLYLCCSCYPKQMTCGTSSVTPNKGPRIAGGKYTQPGEYPFMVSLQKAMNNKHFCGGSVLNDYWILTAAHCVTKYVNNPDKFWAVVGLYKLSDGTAPSVRYMKIPKIIIHEGYNNMTFANDIALLRIDKLINMAESEGAVNAICLPDAYSLRPEGNAKVIGWGRTSLNDTTNTNILTEAPVPILHNEVCNMAYNLKPHDELPDSMICAGDDDHDACTNDSGGPLFQTTEEGVSTLIGIVSHGSACGAKLYPGVYTKVASFIPWIQMVMQIY